MADNRAAKSHLNSINTTLNDLRDLNKINNAVDLIKETSLKLCNILWWQNLLVDTAIKNGLQTISNYLQNGGIWTKAQTEILRLEWERGLLLPWWKNATRVAEIGHELSGLTQIADNTWTVTGTVTTRQNEYNQLFTHADYFTLGGDLTDLRINITNNPVTWTHTINMKNEFVGGNPDPSSYELCDDNWDKLTKVWSDYQIQIWWQTYTLGWIDTTWPNLDCSHITINPLPTKLPLDIKLSVNASYPVTVWLDTINVTCNKKIKINLNDWTTKVNTEPLRDTAFQEYEDSGWCHAISAQLNTKINVRDDDPEIWKNVLERKAIEAALKYKWGTKYDSLTEKQKRLFYERICRSFAWWPWLFAPVYTWGWVIGVDPTRYNNMKAWFIHGSRPWNNDSSVIWSASAYKAFIHSHLDEKCDEYILTTLQTYLQDDTRNTALKAELSKFLQEIDNNKIDDDQVNWQVHRDLDHRKYRMKRWPRSPFRPRDVNYMRFFSDSTVSLKNQQVNIYTQIDNPEPVNYDMSLNVTWKNSIEVAIKIDGTDEVIKQKSAQPATLVRKIMRDQRIKHGKVRAHIGFNIYKSIIQMAQEKNISLTYRGMEWKMRWNRLHRSRETRKIKLDKNGNIAIKQIDHITTTNTEKDIFVFDQNSFLNVNEFDTGQTNWRLREWLETLWYHFNMAMDALHKQYRKWTERRVMWIIHSRNRMKLPSSFRLSPIKKILNCWTTTNFDFNTSVNSHGTNTKIDFRKNKFTLDTQYKKSDGTMENITVKWRDLWKLLNHREWRVRIFDGRERDIAEWIYVAMIDALRKNAKVARTNFWVRDNITWNMYVLDEDWQFGVIAREDFKWDNKVKNPMRWPLRRWKKKWSLKKKRLDRTARRPLEPEEQRELMKNPFLMQRFIKAMNRRMWLWESVRSIFVK